MPKYMTLMDSSKFKYKFADLLRRLLYPYLLITRFLRTIAWWIICNTSDDPILFTARSGFRYKLRNFNRNPCVNPGPHILRYRGHSYEIGKDVELTSEECNMLQFVGIRWGGRFVETLVDRILTNQRIEH